MEARQALFEAANPGLQETGYEKEQRVLHFKVELRGASTPMPVELHDQRHLTAEER